MNELKEPFGTTNFPTRRIKLGLELLSTLRDIWLRSVRVHTKHRHIFCGRKGEFSRNVVERADHYNRIVVVVVYQVSLLEREV